MTYLRASLSVGFVALLICLPSAISAADDFTPAWSWACVQGSCVKQLLESKDAATSLSLDTCKMFCSSSGMFWPQPTGKVSFGHVVVHLNLNSIDVELKTSGAAQQLVQEAAQIFRKNIEKTVPKGYSFQSGGKSLKVYVTLEEPEVTKLTLYTDESYSLETSPSKDGQINATILANNFFGARHALETLVQLCIYDNIRHQVQIIRDATIIDKPVYPYRGILLDTARSFYSVDSIKRMIDGMAAVKLNSFHWHITDTHSFPFESKSQPRLTKLGAYSPDKVYTAEAIRDLVHYALVRGVQIVPEFDAPAHVGEGWQDTDLTVCFNQPWNKYCVEPPCGQLDPTPDRLYNVLEDIYRDMFEAFQPTVFHMGGDEVSEICWNTTRIQQFMSQRSLGHGKAGFFQLWNYFQENAKQRVFKVNGNQSIPLVLWTSTLTDYNQIDQFLDKDEYIIQVWTTGTDPQINGLLNKGYRLIISNYDALYLDCGFSSWVAKGNNWCSPYKGWQDVYDNSPAKMALVNGKLILGGEVALWSEQSDTTTLDNRLWPRAAAHAERMWAEPDTNWQHALERMLHTRETLVKRGIAADTIQPEWCLQNPGSC